MMSLLVLGLVSCSDDDEKSPLLLSANQVSVMVGKTTSVTISSSEGACMLTVENSEIAKATTEGTEILIEGLTEGNTIVNVSDQIGQTAQINVQVTLNEKNFKLTELTSLIQAAPSDVQSQLKDYQVQAPLKENYLTTATYNVAFDNIKGILKAEMFDNNMMSLKIESAKETDEYEYFKALKTLVESNEAYQFKAAVIGDYLMNGNVNQTEVYVDKAQAEELLEDIDLDYGCYKFGYTFNENYSLSVELNKGKASMIIRIKTFPTEWKWFTTLMGHDMTEVINDYYFSLKSVGMMPPMWQLCMIDGVDTSKEKVNVVFFAENTNPISRIEANYQIEDLEKAKAHWIHEMSDENIKAKYGEFVNTVILKNNPKEEPIQLGTIKETIDWVKSNDISSVLGVIPMFMTEEGWTISPQIDTRGFAITITKMKY